jgi:hypothetical protein
VSSKERRKETKSGHKQTNKHKHQNTTMISQLSKKSPKGRKSPTEESQSEKKKKIMCPLHWNSSKLTVLDLLSVAWGLLEGLDQKSRCGRNDCNISLSVLDSELDGDLEARPLLSGGSNIFTNLLGGLLKKMRN